MCKTSLLVAALSILTVTTGCGSAADEVGSSDVGQVREALTTSEIVVAFRTFDGSHYLTAESDGGGTVSADRSTIQAWERFVISDLDGGQLLSGDRIQIRHVSAEGESFWLTADVNGGGPSSVLRANRATPLGWETFIIRQSGGGPVTGGSSVSLQATTRPFYVSAEQGGGLRGDGSVTVNRSVARGWETFTLLVIGAAELCPFTDTLCLFEDANFGGSRFNARALDPNTGTCVDLRAHGWGGRARSAINTNARSARLLSNSDCSGGAVGINGLEPTLPLLPNGAFIY